LRTDEQLKEYRFGRYVDPRDPLAMHERHPIYRVESTARWDLRPQTEAMVSPRQPAAATNTPTSDAIVAEANKQRAATRAFTEQTATLNQKLTELSQAVGQTEEIAKQNLSLKKDVADLREHLDALDAQLNQSKTAPSPQPSPDKW
jgi:septal ring factor EnvC (AmiA/AmiB activator)